MGGSGALSGMITADVGIIDETGHSREQRGDYSQEHRIKRTAQQRWHVRTCETNEIEDKTEEKQPDRKMHQHGMNRMLQWFAFE